MSDFSELIRKILPLKLSVDSLAPQSGHLSPVSYTLLHILHAFCGILVFLWFYYFIICEKIFMESHDVIKQDSIWAIKISDFTKIVSLEVFQSFSYIIIHFFFPPFPFPLLAFPLTISSSAFAAIFAAFSFFA